VVLICGIVGDFLKIPFLCFSLLIFTDAALYVGGGPVKLNQLYRIKWTQGWYNGRVVGEMAEGLVGVVYKGDSRVHATKVAKIFKDAELWNRKTARVAARIGGSLAEYHSGFF
jgi:hypothetical protein